MNEHDREAVECFRDMVYEYQSDRTLSDDVLSLMDDIYEMVDDFITDAELEAEE